MIETAINSAERDAVETCGRRFGKTDSWKSEADRFDKFSLNTLPSNLHPAILRLTGKAEEDGILKV